MSVSRKKAPTSSRVDMGRIERTLQVSIKLMQRGRREMARRDGRPTTRVAAKLKRRRGCGIERVRASKRTRPSSTQEHSQE